MKIAIVHDWINGMRGGERCLDVFLSLYPAADIFTLFHVPGKTNQRIDQRVKKVSFLNRIPMAQKLYRLLLPFYPLAIRQFSFEGYDLVISLSHAAAKNVQVPQGTPHIVYCFTPMRYIWDQARSYFGIVTPLLWPIILLLRGWDRRGAERPTAFVAISRFIAARIRCFYQRSSAVIFPPVDTAWISPQQEDKQGEAFLWAGALVPYKRPDLVVAAFNQLGVTLWVVGDGPERKRLQEIAGPNIHFLGRLSDQDLADRYRRCRALIFPGVEDFGMIPIECMAAGRPIIGLDKGGLVDSLNGVKHWKYSDKSDVIAIGQPSGVFIRSAAKDSLEELLKSIRFFIAHESSFKSRDLVGQAERFSPHHFAEQWNELLMRCGLMHLLVELP